MYLSGYENMRLMKAADYNYLLDDFNRHTVDLENDTIEYEYLEKDGRIVRLKGKLSTILDNVPEIINNYHQGIIVNNDENRFSIIKYSKGIQNLNYKKRENENSNESDQLDTLHYEELDKNPIEEIEDNLYLDYGAKKLKELNRKFMIDFQVNIITLMKAVLKGIPGTLNDFKDLMSKPGTEELRELLMDLQGNDLQKLMKRL